MDGLEDAARAVERRLDELPLGVRPAVVERAGGVQDDFQILGVLCDDGVEGVREGNVRDDGDGEVG